VLAVHADNETGEAWPSRRRIAGTRITSEIRAS
jgi:hypothetical protein